VLDPEQFVFPSFTVNHREMDKPLTASMIWRRSPGIAPRAFTAGAESQESLPVGYRFKYPAVDGTVDEVVRIAV
jgi:hypothetical protein